MHLQQIKTHENFSLLPARLNMKQQFRLISMKASQTKIPLTRFDHSQDLKTKLKNPFCYQAKHGISNLKFEIKRSVESQISNPAQHGGGDMKDSSSIFNLKSQISNLKSNEAWNPFLYPRSCRRKAAKIIMA